jgi:ABC-type sugar transport system ATPase subunit
LFVAEVNAIGNESEEVTDRILEMKDGATLQSTNIATDLESELIEGMLGWKLSQINKIPNHNDTFLNLMISNTGGDLRVSNL